MTILQNVAPENIEDESFRIIEAEFEAQTGLKKSEFPSDSFAIIRRVIHATGDFSFAKTLKISPNAIRAGLDAITQGKSIYADVGMLQAGISKVYAKKYENSILCRIGDSKTAELAREKGTTRSEAAISSLDMQGMGIIAVGNAPTALIKTIDLCRQMNTRPNLVVGVPVGFVNAAESKLLLEESGLEYITVSGRRGGSPVAAAIINALYKLV